MVNATLKVWHVLVKNLYNDKQISRVSLDKEVVEAIIFYTKNPILLISRVEEIRAMGYSIGCQVSITPYQKDIKPRVYNREKIILAFKVLSKKLGKKKLIWRYDPIFINEKYTVEYYVKDSQ